MSKNKQWPKLVQIIFTIGVLIFVAVALFTGSITIKMEDSTISFKASMTVSHSVDYSDIEEVNYISSFEKGKRTNGVGSFQLQSGHFKNDQYSNYYLYSYTSCSEYVELKTKTGYVVFNDKTPEKTKQLYNQLLEKVK